MVKLDMYASDLGAFYFKECRVATLQAIQLLIPFQQLDLRLLSSTFLISHILPTFITHRICLQPELEEDPYLQYMIDGEVVGLDPMAGTMGYEPLVFHSPGESSMHV